ncbi:hypothetical protein PIB30_101905 [Stylosanthes scabra]|uniref:RNase H type-1 domain-containing protein n=1 Tax=Stylosanthes scabra TaxID=79078 RepID=A0ABU6TXZ7_9FABA|nr:hypothetical protein [Stylosanthes scabra]
MRVQALCISSAKELEESATFSSSLLPTSLVSDWCPPMDTQIKVNCDVGVLFNSNSADFACVMRDAKGSWIRGCAEAVANLDLVSKILDLLERNWWVDIRLIQRSANGVANAMAKTAARQHLPHAEWLHPWNDLLPLPREDFPTL